MTATIIAFPVVKRPPAKKPISRKERLEQLFGPEDVAARMKELGLRPENLSPNMDPMRRPAQREEQLRAIFRLANIMKDQGLRAEDLPEELDPNARRLIGLLNSDGATGSDGDTVA